MFFLLEIDQGGNININTRTLIPYIKFCGSGEFWKFVLYKSATAFIDLLSE